MTGTPIGTPIGTPAGRPTGNRTGNGTGNVGRRGLAAEVRLRRGAFDLDVRLDVRPGETVAVVGPNGAGKTTLLRALAGLERLDAGRIVLDETVLDDPAAAVFVRPEHRSVGVVFQDYLLFPKLDVLDNVAFGLRSRGGLRRRAARRAAAGWVERFGLTELAGRLPGQLSGGQAQRVALARALATEPSLLLLDEPLSALDAATRLDVRAGLRNVLAELAVPVVVVTHDLVDALTLADRIVVVENGGVAQAGEPAEVVRRPRTDYVARLAGLELLTGTVTSSDGASGEPILCLAGGARLPLPLADAKIDQCSAASDADADADADAALAGPVLVALRPDAVALVPVHADGTPAPEPDDERVVLRRGQVDGIEPIGERLRVTVGPHPVVRADLGAAQFAALSLARGTEVTLLVDPARLTVYSR